MSKKTITVLLPFYLIKEYKDIFEELGYAVIWADNKEALEEMILTHKIDIALEWQHGRDDHTILNLVRKYYAHVPVLLMLNWNHMPPDNFAELGYVDTLPVPININELKEKIHFYCKHT